MFPVLVDVYGFPIHTYGVLLALGFAAALYTTITLGRAAGFRSEDMGDIALVALISGLIGGRILYVIVEWDQFQGHLASIILRRDGFVFYGGLLIAIPSCILFIRRRGLPLPQMADILAPAVVLGHSFGRLGCFAQGCCYGRPSQYGLSFPSDSAAGITFGGVPVIPTQLYESLALLVLFGVLLWFSRRRPFPGAVFLLYMAVYAVIRFGLELFRADDRGFYLGSFSVSQLISIGLLLAAGIFTYRLKPSTPSR